MIESLSNASYLNHLNQHEPMTAHDELELRPASSTRLFSSAVGIH